MKASEDRATPPKDARIPLRETGNLSSSAGPDMLIRGSCRTRSLPMDTVANFEDAHVVHNGDVETENADAPINVPTTRMTSGKTRGTNEREVRRRFRRAWVRRCAPVGTLVSWVQCFSIAWRRVNHQRRRDLQSRKSVAGHCMLDRTPSLRTT